MERRFPVVERNERIAERYYLLTLDLGSGAQAAQPGQFMTFRLGSGVHPLLRRPFAFASCHTDGSQASVIYELRGSATRHLVAATRGERLDYLGPLGNSFPTPPPGVRPVLVAGGVGMGPIFFFHDSLRRQGHRPLLVLGARDAARVPVPLLPEGCVVATDDGSWGRRGTVLTALEAELGQPAGLAADLVFYACGPNSMMEALGTWLAPAPTPPPLWLSMEQTMGCAVGACMGCAIPVRPGKPYERVCTEGPIFAGERVDWARFGIAT